jgi:hypothetical protein
MTITTVDGFRAGKGAPVPGALVGDGVVFAILAMVAEVAPTPAALAAWGFIIAAVIATPAMIPPAVAIRPAKSTAKAA